MNERAPTITEVVVPAGGMAGTEALLTAWRRNVGDRVNAGDVIAEVETDKATVEIESPATGIIRSLLYEQGGVVPLGQAIAQIATDLSDGRTATAGLPDGGAGRSARAPTKDEPRPLASFAAPPRTTKPTVSGKAQPRLTHLRYPQTTSVGLDLSDVPISDLGDWLATMMLIRQFEEACEPVSNAGKIPGGMHSSSGQEAVAVGTARALRPHDVVISSHRSHHTSLAKGISPDAVMAELYGKGSGCAGGRGGHMHLAAFDIGMWGSNGIVGGGLAIAVGVALAAKLRELDQVSVGFFGDGGANTGRVWEALNLAAIWELPLIAICENNLYAVETFVGRVTAAESIAARASGFGVFAEQVDGQDICAMYRAVQRARLRALEGRGPTFIEALTFRYRGHNTGDPERYRTKDEVNAWRETRDPIARLADAMRLRKLVTDDELTVIAESIAQTVADAVAFAEAADWPDGESAALGVYGSPLQ